MITATFKDKNAELVLEFEKQNMIGIRRFDGMVLYVNMSYNQLEELAKFLNNFIASKE